MFGRIIDVKSFLERSWIVDQSISSDYILGKVVATRARVPVAEAHQGGGIHVRQSSNDGL